MQLFASPVTVLHIVTRAREPDITPRKCEEISDDDESVNLHTANRLTKLHG